MKVFLGGTCNGSTWRQKLIPMLQLDYFNPVVEDWTPECAAEELVQRDICDIRLYVITPRMIGVYSIAEVVDDSNKRPTRTVFVPLLEDEGAAFSTSQWKSMQAVSRMVSENGASVFYSLEEAADNINELLHR